MNEAAKLLRKGYQAYARGDVGEVMSVLANDLVWHLPGQGPLSGDIKGKTELAAYFDKKMELSGGTFRHEVHDVFGNDIRAVGIVSYTAERNGKALRTKSFHVADVENGQIAEFSEYFEDQYAWDEFWSENASGSSKGGGS